MSFLVYAPFVLPVFLSLFARRLTGAVDPQAAARALAAGAVVVSAAGVGCLALLTLTLIDVAVRGEAPGAGARSGGLCRRCAAGDIGLAGRFGDPSPP
jgi:hypothetical protein